MSIFVSIPSYRDPECQHTIQDLLEKAKYPEKISVGVCFQYDKERDTHCFEHWPKGLYPDQVLFCPHSSGLNYEIDRKFISRLKFVVCSIIRKIRVQHVDAKEATGPCWARYMTQQLYQGEEYYLSIDSHTRFIKHWDEVLISLLQSCPSPKPIITTYPHDYKLPNKLTLETKPILTCAKEFGDDGILRLTGKLLNKSFCHPIQALFWVSGFSFSKATIINEVPYDPHLPFLFFGEEISMTVRLWTHGWDFFAPGRVVIYHLWSRDYRPNFRENRDMTGKESRSQRRVKYLLGMIDNVEEEVLVEFDKYGLSKESLLSDTKRSLTAYQEFSGINFKDQTITQRAKWGGLDKSDFMDHIIELLNQFVKQ